MYENHFLLLRDFSVLSNEMEKYLKELNVPLITYYTEDDPTIFAPNSFSSFSGNKGFTMFKLLYKNKNLDEE